MGKPEQRLGDSLDGFDPDPEPAAVAAYFADPFADAHRLLGQATTRVLYDLDAYRRTRHEPQPQPAGVAVLARETHVSDLAPGQRTKIQRSFSYSDGFGREVQHKGQAAAGPVTDGGPDDRAPLDRQRLDRLQQQGPAGPQLRAVLHRDARVRVRPRRRRQRRAVLRPGRAGRGHPASGRQLRQDRFDPWHQDTWDAQRHRAARPSRRPGRGRLHRPLPRRCSASGRAAGRPGTRSASAVRSARPSSVPPSRPARTPDTPARGWLDTLGRTFLTVAHNRAPEHGRLADQYCRTHSVLDIQGNEHEVRDALGRAVMRYGYAMTAAQLTHAGMDTGGGQLLPDVTGKPVYSGTPAGSPSAPTTTRCADRCAPTSRAPASPARRCRRGPSTARACPTPRPGTCARGSRGSTTVPASSPTRPTTSRATCSTHERQLAAEYRDVVDWASRRPARGP